MQYSEYYDYLFNKRSLIHFITGVIAYLLGIKFIFWLIMHLVFEVIINTRPGIDIINHLLGESRKDMLIEAIYRTFWGMAGWAVAWALNRQCPD